MTHTYTHIEASGDKVQLTNQSVSRYLKEYEELEILGKGSFGQVNKVRNSLDGKTYAIKKIRLRRGDQLNKIIREVTLLSQVHHKNCLRYY